MTKPDDIDRVGRKVAGTYNDSITLCLRRTLKQATLVELDNNSELIARALVGREIDALGANRQRLTNLMKSVPGSRLLPAEKDADLKQADDDP